MNAEPYSEQGKHLGRHPREALTSDESLQKADFGAIYDQPDPRAYFLTLEPFDYVIPEHGAELFARLLQARGSVQAQHPPCALPHMRTSCDPEGASFAYDPSMCASANRRCRDWLLARREPRGRASRAASIGCTQLFNVLAGQHAIGSVHATGRYGPGPVLRSLPHRGPPRQSQPTYAASSDPLLIAHYDAGAIETFLLDGDPQPGQVARILDMTPTAPSTVSI